MLRASEPNLVAGIKWLQRTFVTRLNRFTGSVKAKRDLATDLAKTSPEADEDSADLRDLNEARRRSILPVEMKAVGKPEFNLENDRKAVAWIIKRAKQER